MGMASLPPLGKFLHTPLVTGLMMHHKSAKSSPLKLDSFEI